MSEVRDATPLNRFELTRTGEGVGIWAAVGVNAVLSSIDEAMDGAATIASGSIVARTGSSDDLRRRVWHVVGDARTIFVPEFAGVRFVSCDAAGVVLRTSRSFVELPAGLSTVHMLDGTIRRVVDRDPIAVDVPTANPVKRRTVSLMSTLADAVLPAPTPGDWIVVSAGPNGSTITGPIQSRIQRRGLATLGRTLTTGGRRIVAAFWDGDTTSVRIGAGRTARFVAYEGTWIQC
ncbi:hypothetical protein [Aureimonas sp. AU40]|uniref:hypothetical protein n=1 Tax=Aureimonas sp. AU40 TaxID=1637747 RepID=UPI000780567C|nr:hypothetical protein [Aureimonas sp. AU40]